MKPFLRFLPLCVLLLSVRVSCATEIYVDQTASGTGDGSDWGNAFIFLQDGVDAAVSGDSIRIAEGTYYPDEGSGQVADASGSTFLVPGGVTLLGGYGAGGKNRDTTQYFSILSGDIDGDDTIFQESFTVASANDLNGKNAEQVVTFNASSETPTLLDGLIISAGNSPGNGGGLVATADNLEVRDCRFIGNKAVGRGGAVLVSDADTRFVGCTFVGNVSTNRGGAFATLSSADPQLTNCVFFGNQAQRGGALNFNDSTPTLTNCSISGNSGTLNGGGIQAATNSVVTVENTIIWNNHAAGNRSAGGSSANLISGSSISFATCLMENDGGADPQFLIPPDPANAPTSTGFLAISANSPAVDSGTDALNQEPSDLIGNLRSIGVAIDIGAHEETSQTGLAQLFVDSTATGNNDGRSWNHAFDNLQDALAVAVAGDRIRIAAGTYYPDEGAGQTNNDRGSTFSISGDGVTVIGGYPAGGGRRDIEANTTILSGDLQGDDINADGNNIVEDVSQIVGDNAYSVVTTSGGSSTVTLVGLTITAGLADDDVVGFRTNQGAGIYAIISSLNLEDTVVIGNQCSQRGAGIYFRGTQLQTRNSRFLSNSVDRDTGGSSGAGIYFWGDHLIVSACHFEGNSLSGTTAGLRGYAIRADGVNPSSTCVVEDTVINNHRADDTAISTSYTIAIREMETVEFARCSISGNDCEDSNSSAILLSESNDTITIRDCAFTGNRAGQTASIYASGSSADHQRISFLNTTIAGSVGNFIERFTTDTSGELIIYNSIIGQPIGAGMTSFAITRGFSIVAGQPGMDQGNLPDTTDSGFIDPRPTSEAPTDAGDYRLAATSTLIDAGFNEPIMSHLDLGGLMRIFDGDDNGSALIDLGAHEFGAPIAPPVVIPELEITGITYDPSSGDVILTVESSIGTAYTAQFSTSLTSWSPVVLGTGNFAPGTNVIAIRGVAYDAPLGRVYFRLITPK